MEQIDLTYSQAILYLAMIGIFVGALLGLIPLILGIKRKKRQYGIFGFLSSIVLGLVSPILSIIVVAVFTWLILKKPTVEEPVDAAASENPVDVKIENPENR